MCDFFDAVVLNLEYNFRKDAILTSLNLFEKRNESNAGGASFEWLCGF